jgi:hypothetical protein
MSVGLLCLLFWLGFRRFDWERDTQRRFVLVNDRGYQPPRKYR